MYRIMAVVLVFGLCGMVFAANPADDEAVIKGFGKTLEALGGYEAEYTWDTLYLINPGMTNGKYNYVVEPPNPRNYTIRCIWREDAKQRVFEYIATYPTGEQRTFLHDGKEVFFGERGKFIKKPMGEHVDMEKVAQEASLGVRRSATELYQRELSRILSLGIIRHPLMLFGDLSGMLPLEYSTKASEWDEVDSKGYQHHRTMRNTFVRSAPGFVKIRGVDTIQFDRLYLDWSADKTKPRKAEPKYVQDRWWLDPNKGSLPIRIDHLSFGKLELPLERTEIMDMMQLGPNVWFPKKGTITHFVPGGVFTPAEMAEARMALRNMVPSSVETITVTSVSHGKNYARDEFTPNNVVKPIVSVR